MKWIKHHTNASTATKLSELLDLHGVFYYGEYWLLLEVLGERFDGVCTEIVISMHDVKAKLRSKSNQKLHKSIELFSALSLLTFSVDKKFYKFNCPILFELQDSDSKYNRSKRVDSDAKKKKQKKKEEVEEDLEADVEAEPISEFSGNYLTKQLLKNVPVKTQTLWLQTYPDIPWLHSEFAKMLNWLEVNPEKRPKSRLARFISSWLSRGWESHRKTIPGKFSKSEGHPGKREVPKITDRQIELLKQAGQL